MASINNPDIIILGGLDDFVPTTETAADISVHTAEPTKSTNITEIQRMYFGLGAVVGAVLGIIGTYIAVKKR
jgi:hypothetical protein